MCVQCLCCCIEVEIVVLCVWVCCWVVQWQYEGVLLFGVVDQWCWQEMWGWVGCVFGG